jgi:hypothetical protein
LVHEFSLLQHDLRISKILATFAEIDSEELWEPHVALMDDDSRQKA